jgi:hypothetical protein
VISLAGDAPSTSQTHRTPAEYRAEWEKSNAPYWGEVLGISTNGLLVRIFVIFDPADTKNKVGVEPPFTILLTGAGTNNMPFPIIKFCGEKAGATFEITPTNVIAVNTSGGGSCSLRVTPTNIVAVHANGFVDPRFRVVTTNIVEQWKFKGYVR